MDCSGCSCCRSRRLRLRRNGTNFVFVEDGFKVNFPGRPQVENTTWTSQYRYTLPARVYRASRGAERYSVTVVDYRGLEKQGVERSKQCPPGAETCIGTQDGRQGGILGLGYWKMDVRGAWPLPYSSSCSATPSSLI